MKILFLLLLPISALCSETANLSLSDVAKQVSEKNFLVYENALKVYQAKTTVEKARADLLPRLSIWNIAKIAFDPSSVVDSVKDIAPFLVPANWFRVKESKLLYLADKEGYRALWGNEIHSAKSLYLNLLLDEKLLEHIKASSAELKRIHLIVKTREMFGGAPQGTARDMELKLLGLAEDERNISALVIDERSALLYSLGLPVDTSLSVSPVAMPDFTALPRLDYKKYEFRVLSSSPERRQFDHFLSVLSQVKREIEYSFLGASSTSRGVSGGVFDSLPTPDGLGFGQGPAMRIVETQRQIMLSQKRGVEETLKRQLKALTDKFNLDLDQYENFQRRSRLSQEGKTQLLRRIQLGDDVSMPELAEISRTQVQAETALYSMRYRLMVSLDRLERLTFEGDYSMQPPVIDSLIGSKR